MKYNIHVYGMPYTIFWTLISRTRSTEMEVKDQILVLSSDHNFLFTEDILLKLPTHIHICITTWQCHFVIKHLEMWGQGLKSRSKFTVWLSMP